MDGAILEDVAITNITMRDLVDVPFFLRLGSRMRGPEGTPVGELRRVLISNIVVSNCASRQATIIAGIPGHYIEDVTLSNVLVLHQGGGTKGRRQQFNHRNWRMYIPTQTASDHYRRTASTSAMRRESR